MPFVKHGEPHVFDVPREAGVENLVVEEVKDEGKC